MVHRSKSDASLIERQQKAIDLLLRAIEPFAATADKMDDVRSHLTSFMTDQYEASASIVGWKYEDARAARAAKEEAEKILNQQGEGS